MALGNFFNTGKTEAGYLLNYKNYNQNPLKVAKNAYAPTMEKIGSKAKETANNALEYAMDGLSLSPEAQRELANKGAKGWKAPKSF